MRGVRKRILLHYSMSCITRDSLVGVAVRLVVAPVGHDVRLCESTVTSAFLVPVNRLAPQSLRADAYLIRKKSPSVLLPPSTTRSSIKQLLQKLLPKPISNTSSVPPFAMDTIKFVSVLVALKDCPLTGSVET